MRRGALLLAAMTLAVPCGLLSCATALAQNLSVDVSEYYCRQLDGVPSGLGCNAPYRPFPGDACGIYEGLGIDYQPLLDLYAEVTGSCTAGSVETAKRKTLESRYQLRSYVSLGNDESVNDPTVNTGYRAEGVTRSYGEEYFTAECAIQRCSSGETGPQAPYSLPSDESQPPSDEPAWSPGPNSCLYANDQMCDEPSGMCEAGTDTDDCNLAPIGTQPEVPPAPADTRGTVNFEIRNYTSVAIDLKFATEDRGGWWPEPGSHYTLADHEISSYKLSCDVGQKICFGAGFGLDTGNYWGRGLQGKQACDDCCLICSWGDAPATRVWNLVRTEEGPIVDGPVVELEDRVAETGGGVVALYTTPSGRFYGVARGKSEQEAKLRAKDNCEISKADTASTPEERREPCNGVVWTARGCVALAHSSEYLVGPEENHYRAAAARPTISQARNAALAQCTNSGGPNCQVWPETVQCSDWTLHYR